MFLHLHSAVIGGMKVSGRTSTHHFHALEKTAYL